MGLTDSDPAPPDRGYLPHVEISNRSTVAPTATAGFDLALMYDVVLPPELCRYIDTCGCL